MCNANIVKIVLEVFEDVHHCNTVVRDVVWDREIDVFLLTIKWRNLQIATILDVKYKYITLKDERVTSAANSSVSSMIL